MAKSPKAYTAPEPVYTAGIWTKPGDVFVTDAEPNDNWTEVKPKDAHAIQASTEKVSPDVPLENQSLDALRALALTKNVNPDGMSKKDLIAAIKAANEPAL